MPRRSRAVLWGSRDELDAAASSGAAIVGSALIAEWPDMSALRCVGSSHHKHGSWDTSQPLSRSPSWRCRPFDQPFVGTQDKLRTSRLRILGRYAGSNPDYVEGNHRPFDGLRGASIEPRSSGTTCCAAYPPSGERIERGYLVGSTPEHAGVMLLTAT